MTTRLNKTIKTEILAAVLKDKIQPKIDAQRAKAQKIADRTMQNLYDEQIRDWLAAAPEGGCYTKSSIRLRIENVGIFDHEMLGEKDHRRPVFNLSKSVRVLARHQYEERFTPSRRDQGYLIDALKALDAIEKERDQLRSTINAALNSCSTLKKLEDQYPSLKKYIPEVECTSANLPAITDQKVAEALAA